jgi:hypothetical protein
VSLSMSAGSSVSAFGIDIDSRGLRGSNPLEGVLARYWGNPSDQDRGSASPAVHSANILHRYS